MKHALRQDGIAIGPILFIIAILAILATAISAGSNSFTGNTENEKNRTMAAELIQMGQNYKAGVDRLQALGYAAVEPSTVVTENSNPQLVVYYDCDATGPGGGKNCLFSPLGGGALVPPPTLAADQNAPFVYNNGANSRYIGVIEVDKLGTSDGEVVFLYAVTKEVCEAVRSILHQTSTMLATTLSDDPASFINPSSASLHPIVDGGYLQGCLQENDNWNVYAFYQVLAVR